MFGSNGFKKIVKDIIEANCKEANLNVSIIDVSKQERLFYIFNKDWNCMATIQAYFMEKEMSIKGSLDISKIVGIANKPYEKRCNYLSFFDINNKIDEIFNGIKDKIKDKDD